MIDPIFYISAILVSVVFDELTHRRCSAVRKGHILGINWSCSRNIFISVLEVINKEFIYIRIRLKFSAEEHVRTWKPKVYHSFGKMEFLKGYDEQINMRCLSIEEWAVMIMVLHSWHSFLAKVPWNSGKAKTYFRVSFFATGKPWFGPLSTSALEIFSILC